jgi:hypothetical protein
MALTVEVVVRADVSSYDSHLQAGTPHPLRERNYAHHCLVYGQQ